MEEFQQPTNCHKVCHGVNLKIFLPSHRTSTRKTANNIITFWLFTCNSDDWVVSRPSPNRQEIRNFLFLRHMKIIFLFFWGFSVAGTSILSTTDHEYIYIYMPSVPVNIFRVIFIFINFIYCSLSTKNVVNSFLIEFLEAVKEMVENKNTLKLQTWIQSILNSPFSKVQKACIKVASFRNNNVQHHCENTTWILVENEWGENEIYWCFKGFQLKPYILSVSNLITHYRQNPGAVQAAISANNGLPTNGFLSKSQ